LQLLAARDGRQGAVTIHQDVDLYGSVLARGDRVQHELRPGRHAWIQIARGAVGVNGVQLGQGDGAAISGERALSIESADRGAELLLFDLA
jgi:redox-sensitive bicupin YhaK (pirin superfamily)